MNVVASILLKSENWYAEGATRLPLVGGCDFHCVLISLVVYAVVAVLAWLFCLDVYKHIHPFSRENTATVPLPRGYQPTTTSAQSRNLKVGFSYSFGSAE